MVKARRQPEWEPEEDFDLQIEMENGLVIGEHRGRYSVSLERQHLGSFSDFDEALRFGAQKLEDTHYWPNVFYVNERGNVNLLSIRPKIIKGKVIKVDYKYLHGWV